MVDIKKTKFGFSLAEALVSMLVMSMFFMVSSKIITTKPKKEIQMNRHGYFECFKDKTGVLKQKRSDGSYAGVAVNASSDTCKFTPPSGIAFAIIYYYKDKKFFVSTEPQFNADGASQEITITKSELSAFASEDNQLMEVDKDDNGNDNIYALKNFFMSCYPSSSIYEIIKDVTEENNTYDGPAVFIGW